MKELSIKNITKELFAVKKVNPHTHWNNLLYIFFMVAITLVSFSIYLLMSLNKEQSLQIAPEESSSPSLIDEKLLKKVTDSFSNKALIEKQIKDGFIFYKDPSN